MNPSAEPVRFAGAIAGFVYAACTCLIGFHVVIMTQEQVALVMGFVGAACTLGQVLFARAKVTANTAVQGKVDAAVAAAGS